MVEVLVGVQGAKPPEALRFGVMKWTEIQVIFVIEMSKKQSVMTYWYGTGKHTWHITTLLGSMVKVIWEAPTSSAIWWILEAYEMDRNSIYFFNRNVKEAKRKDLSIWNQQSHEDPVGVKGRSPSRVQSANLAPESSEIWGILEAWKSPKCSLFLLEKCQKTTQQKFGGFQRRSSSGARGKRGAPRFWTI